MRKLTENKRKMLKMRRNGSRERWKGESKTRK